MTEIKRHCYFPNNRPRVWWWKIVDSAGAIISDGFSSKAEAKRWLTASGMSASGQDPNGLEAKPASPTREAGDAQQ